MPKNCIARFSEAVPALGQAEPPVDARSRPCSSPSSCDARSPPMPPDDRRAAASRRHKSPGSSGRRRSRAADAARDDPQRPARRRGSRGSPFPQLHLPLDHLTFEGIGAIAVVGKRHDRRDRRAASISPSGSARPPCAAGASGPAPCRPRRRRALARATTCPGEVG